MEVTDEESKKLGESAHILDGQKHLPIIEVKDYTHVEVSITSTEGTESGSDRLVREEPSSQKGNLLAGIGAPRSDTSTESKETPAVDVPSPQEIPHAKTTVEYPRLRDDGLFDIVACKGIQTEIDKAYNRMLEHKKAFSEHYSEFHHECEKIGALFEEFVKEINKTVF